MDCLLCNNSQISIFYKDALNQFYHCERCDGLSRNPDTFLNPTDEKARYLTHNNDVEDKGYQKFVEPLVKHVLRNFSPEDSIGLDYGAGTGPVISKLLVDKGYKINLYDPFFHPNTSVLNRTYDYIVCCEVIEHFFNPLEEFKKLKEFLNPNGLLICKTDLHYPGLNFAKWYYKNDPSHVFIYSKKTLAWIQKNLDFKSLEVNNRTLVFKV